MARLRDITYNPETGEFFRSGDKIKGTVNNYGYVMIRVYYTLYHAHRLAWYLHYRKWPKEIDHINGIKSDNRLSNLREVTRSENMLNHYRLKKERG